MSNVILKQLNWVTRNFKLLSQVSAQVRQQASETVPTVERNFKHHRALPGGENRLRRHMNDMQRLMDHMRQEMEALDQP